MKKGFVRAFQPHDDAPAVTVDPLQVPTPPSSPVVTLGPAIPSLGGAAAAAARAPGGPCPQRPPGGAWQAEEDLPPLGALPADEQVGLRLLSAGPVERSASSGGASRPAGSELCPSLPASPQPVPPLLQDAAGPGARCPCCQRLRRGGVSEAVALVDRGCFLPVARQSPQGAGSPPLAAPEEAEADVLDERQAPVTLPRRQKSLSEGFPRPRRPSPARATSSAAALDRDPSQAATGLLPGRRERAHAGFGPGGGGGREEEQQQRRPPEVEDGPDAGLQRRCEELEAERDELQRQVEQLQALCTLLEEDGGDCLELADLRERCHKLEEEKWQLSLQVDQYWTIYKQLEAENQRMDGGETESQKRRKRTMEMENKALQLQLGQMRQTCDALEAVQVDELRAVAAALDAFRHRAPADAPAVVDPLEEASSGTPQSTLAGRCVALELEREQLLEHLDALEASHETLARRAAKLEDRCSWLELNFSQVDVVTVGVQTDADVGTTSEAPEVKREEMPPAAGAEEEARALRSAAEELRARCEALQEENRRRGSQPARASSVEARSGHRRGGGE